MADEWLTPTTVADSGTATPLVRPAFELRPLSLGEILDRTFTIFRSRFWLFAGIAAFAAAAQTVISGLQMFTMNIGAISAKDPTNGALMGLGVGLAMLAAAAVFLIALSMTQAATAYALSEVYLGHSMTTMGAFRATRKWWYRYIGITFWQIFSAAWIPSLLAIVGLILTVLKTPGIGFIWVVLGLGIVAGLVVGVIQYLRNSLAVPAVVIEGLTVRPAMKRSKMLAADTKGRLFVVYLLAAALKYAGSLLQMPLLFLTIFKTARGQSPWLTEVIALVVIFVVNSVVEPVLMLGLTLVYFDQRVRKEALDIVMMMGPEVAAAPVAPVYEAPAVYETPVVVEETAARHEPVVAAGPTDQAGDETLP